MSVKYTENPSHFISPENKHFFYTTYAIKPITCEIAERELHNPMHFFFHWWPFKNNCGLLKALNSLKFVPVCCRSYHIPGRVWDCAHSCGSWGSKDFVFHLDFVSLAQCFTLLYMFWYLIEFLSVWFSASFVANCLSPTDCFSLFYGDFFFSLPKEVKTASLNMVVA